MFLNFWRPYKYLKPKHPGFYLCTVQHGAGINRSVVMQLFYSSDGRWINYDRQNVFDGYNVYTSGRLAIEANKIYTDSLCERIDVTAWRPSPEPCDIWRLK